jgi:SulP family sulfate permease
VTLLALLSGIFQLGFGLARAGILLSLVSHPVLMGFINAAALIIAMSQLPACWESRPARAGTCSRIRGM